MPVAGRDITERFSKMMMGQQGLRFSTPSELEQVREVKEHLCYVALDY